MMLSEEMAMLTEDRYRQHRNKKMQYIGFMQNGELTGYNSASHVKAALRFLPHEDGLTFNITPVFTDSLRTELSDDNTGGRITMDRVCGPVEVINDTTFRVSFYRMGMYNPRRTADITLLTSNCGDKKYKGAVQELSLKITYRNTGGKRQYIMFPGIEDISAGTKEVTLNAVSDCDLPVSYYVYYWFSIFMYFLYSGPSYGGSPKPRELLCTFYIQDLRTVGHQNLVS